MKSGLVGDLHDIQTPPCLLICTPFSLRPACFFCVLSLCALTPPQTSTTHRLDSCHQLPALNSHLGLFQSCKSSTRRLDGCLAVNYCQKGRLCPELMSLRSAYLYFRFCRFEDGGFQVLSKYKLQRNDPFLVFESDVSQKLHYVGMICVASVQRVIGKKKQFTKLAQDELKQDGCVILNHEISKLFWFGDYKLKYWFCRS